MPGQRAIGEHADATGPIDLGAGRLAQHPGQGRGLDARGPDLDPSGDPALLFILLDDHAGPIDVGDDARHVQLDPEALESLRSLGGQALAEGREHLLAAVEEQDPRTGRINPPEVVLQHPP